MTSHIYNSQINMVNQRVPGSYPQLFCNQVKTRKKGQCIPMSIKNALQTNELKEPKNKKSWGYKNNETVRLCQHNNIFVINMTKHYKNWRKHTWDRILNSNAPLVVIGDIKNNMGK
jgi:hypothetical protein